MNHSYIEKAIRQGYSFNLGAYSSRAFQTFKRIPILYLTFTGIYLLVHLVSGILVTGIIWIFVSYPLITGYAIGTHLFVTKKSTDLGNFFKGFDHVWPLVILYLINLVAYIGLFSLLIFTVLWPYVVEEPTSREFSSYFIDVMDTPQGFVAIISALFLSGYVTLATRWAPLFVVFFNYKPMKALVTSIALINKNFGGQMLFIFMVMGYLFLGTLMVFIGLAVAIPLIIITDYFAFADVTGLDRVETEIDELGMESYNP